VLLIGGTGLIDFRLRGAQSYLRSDLFPSYWSHVGIVTSSTTFLTVPLDDSLSLTAVPSQNAIHDCSLSTYDDPAQYPNIAVINFVDDGAVIVANARQLQLQRSAMDLPHLLAAWLGFGWGAGDAANPLAQGIGMPGAVMTETAFGVAGAELSPGLAASATCPEALWQSAIWWHEYYGATADAKVQGQPMYRGERPPKDTPAIIVPSGAYVTRQPAAAVTSPVAVDRRTQPSAMSRARGTGRAEARRRGR
jgi:hypothetical protein